MNRRKLNFVAIALLAGTLTSCEMDNVPARFKNEGKVGIVVSDASSLTTKSAGSTEELIGSALLKDIDGMDFRLDAYVEENSMMPFVEEIQTKGSIVTTDGSNSTVNINAAGSQFAFHAWLGSDNRYPNSGSAGLVNDATDATNFHFIGTTATKESDAWTFGDYYWRNAVPTSFWSYYPVGTTTVSLPANNAGDDAQKVVGFTYSTPAGVAEQKDVLFAYNLHTVTFDEKGNSDDNEFININFYHALAAIRFDISGAIADNVAISKIFVQDVYTDATCVITGTPGDTNDASGSVAFDWTPDETKKSTFTQTSTDFDFTATGLDGETANALMPLSSSKFFFFVPQAVTGITLGVEYTRTDGTKATRTVTLDHAAWESGKIYTYKLNPASDKVNVTVEETVTASTKSAVKVRNSGNVAEYLRVTIAGNWYEAGYGVTEGLMVLVKPWTFDSSKFSGLNIGTGDTQWSLGTDGYYYSNKPVPAGEALDLFTSFTAEGAPSKDAKLHLDIIAQAVAAWDNANKKMVASWSEAITVVKAATTE